MLLFLANKTRHPNAPPSACKEQHERLLFIGSASCTTSNNLFSRFRTWSWFLLSGLPAMPGLGFSFSPLHPVQHVSFFLMIGQELPALHDTTENKSIIATLVPGFQHWTLIRPSGLPREGTNLLAPLVLHAAPGIFASRSYLSIHVDFSCLVSWA